MQKYTREKRTENYGRISEDFIQFRLYRIRNVEDIKQSMKTGQKFRGEQLERVGNSGDYINKREVVARFRLKPGFYVIIPSLFQANVAGHFMLRTYTEQFNGEKNKAAVPDNNVINKKEVVIEPAKYKTSNLLAESVNVFRPSLLNNMSDNKKGESHWLTAGLMGESLEEHLDKLQKQKGVYEEQVHHKKQNSMVDDGVCSIIKSELVNRIALIDERLDNIRKREVNYVEPKTPINKKQLCRIM